MTYFSSLYWAGFTGVLKNLLMGIVRTRNSRTRNWKRHCTVETSFHGEVELLWCPLPRPASAGPSRWPAQGIAVLLPIPSQTCSQCEIIQLPGAAAARLAASARTAANYHDDLWIRSDWDLFASKLELKLPEQVPGDLALQARRQPLAVARRLQGQKLPKLSGKYCQGKLSDAKGQADSSQPLCCGPYCIQPWVTPRTAHQASWVNQGLCWL